MANRLHTIFVALALVAATAAWGRAADLPSPSPVRLILQITIDQLRADVALRDRGLWGEGGLGRLFDHGAVFSEAHHAHANTETVVGHATLATGADPSVHGLVGNSWFDRTQGRLQSNVEDCRYEVVGEAKAVTDAKAAPAPAGNAGAADRHSAAPAPNPRAARCGGRSPETMLASALADSIAEAGGGRARVFSVSLKDRAAVPMGGRSGKAFWWSDASGRFVSSTWYWPGRRLPGWADAWNRRGEADGIDGRAWTLLLEPARYHEIARDDEPWESPPEGMGRTFPHRFDRRALGRGFYGAVATSPFGDEVLVDFARELIAGESLGRDEVPDYLSVSFSSPDYIGHRFGPDSLEVEDEVLRLDREVAALLQACDEAAGPGHTLVVLSSDHGVVEPVAELTARGRDAGRISLAAVEASPAVKALADRFGGPVIASRASPYVYVDRDGLARRGVDVAVATEALAAELRKTPGIEAAITRRQLETRDLPSTEVTRAVLRNFNRERSGDIHLVAKPGWQIAFDPAWGNAYVANHGSPWRYDTWVPLVFEGPGVAHVEVSRPVRTVDVAPTLAALAGVAAPAKSTGKVLREAIAPVR